MKVSKQTIAVTAKYSDDGRHRYLLRKQWNKDLPEAAVIMINPACEDEISQDLTSMLVLNNVSRDMDISISLILLTMQGMLPEEDVHSARIQYIRY